MQPPMPRARIGGNLGRTTGRESRAQIVWLYEQGAYQISIGRYVKRWKEWLVAGFETFAE